MGLCLHHSVTAGGHACLISSRPGASIASHLAQSVRARKFAFFYHTNIRRHPRSIRTSAVLSASTVSWSIAGSTLYCVPLFLTMICAPGWRMTRRLLSSELMFLPLAATYCFLLSQSWEPDTLSIILPGSLRDGLTGGFNPQFFPKLEGIMSLFSRTITAASLWVHLLSINLYAARTAYLQGLQNGVPTRHTVLLCSVFAPLGVLSAALTDYLVQSKSSSKFNATVPKEG